MAYLKHCNNLAVVNLLDNGVPNDHYETILIKEANEIYT